MSLKQEIETWVSALAAYDNNEFDASLKCFEQIADTSKIFFNLGVINATLGEHGKAVEFYQRAVQLDQYLAVAYFQQGVSNFLMGDFEEALANFNDTLLYLRGNNNIDYEQLGLKFKLYSCEALFNRGLCYIYLQQKDAGMQDLIFASHEKMVPDHDVIDEAIREQAEAYTVFSIPVGVVYRPNEAKVKNLKTKDYLGKARLVASQDYQNVDPRRQAAMAALAIDDRPEGKLSYAALNLVKPDLRSRSRQQSEPPMTRNVFPPTPPPEPERPESMDIFARRKSNDSGNSQSSGMQMKSNIKPLRLELGAAAFDQKAQSERTRQAPKRSESERPPMRRDLYEPSSRPSDTRRTEERRSYREIPEVRIEQDPVEATIQPPVMQQQMMPPPQHASHHQRSRSSAQAPRMQPVTISEEEEEDEVVYPSDSPLAFEIIPPKQSHHRRQPSKSRPTPELRKIRIKVHAEDMRYVMITPNIKYDELVEQIRQKFGLLGAYKLKMRDEEGDLVTLSDDDDLEMAIGLCKAAAAIDKGDTTMGKMELWVMES